MKPALLAIVFQTLLGPILIAIAIHHQRRDIMVSFLSLVSSISVIGIESHVHIFLPVHREVVLHILHIT